MKIVYVSDAIYPYNMGGKEKRLFEIAKRLASFEYDVHVYTMHWWKSSEKVRVENGVTLHAISKKYELYHGERRSIKEGIFFGLACLKLMWVAFDVLDVDHMPFFPIFSVWFVCLVRRKRFYGTWHEALTRREWINYMGVLGNISALIEKISIRLPYKITAASLQTQRLLAEHHGRVKNVDLTVNGIDLSFVKDVIPATAAPDILFVGRLVKDKNVDLLIRSVAQIAKDKPNVACKIIGNGTERSALVALAKNLGISRNIQFVDNLPEASDIYAQMKGARVFCIPSSREGFGIVALEAIACNTPVVSVDTPNNAVKDLVEDGKTGSIVPLTVKDVSRAIENWIDRSSTNSNLTQYIANYDWDYVAARQARVYAP